MNYQLIAGKLHKIGVASSYFSPIDQKEIGRNLVIKKIIDVEKAFLDLDKKDSISKNILIKSFLRLSKEIRKEKLKFAKQVTLETGYVLKDSKEIVEDLIELLDNFKNHIDIIFPKGLEHKFNFSEKSENRKLQLKFLPYGVVASLCSQNSPLIIETVVLTNALYSGNSVVIKPSRQTFGTISLLIEALRKTFPQKILKKISIINCKPEVFLEAAYKHADIIHFIGSSKYAPDIVLKSFKKSKKVLIDGEGGSYVIVDKNTDLDKVSEICSDGIIRCNGELCTSIRGIFVHTDVYQKFKKTLKNRLSFIRVGNPLESETEMGPLFTKDQVILLKKAVPEIESLSFGPNYIRPVLVTDRSKSLINKSLYGPVCFIIPYFQDEWKNYIKKIPYPITIAVFTNNKTLPGEIISCGISPRIVINADPSRESPFEPWGSFPPSGTNDVSFWAKKYLKAIQIDKSL